MRIMITAAIAATICVSNQTMAGMVATEWYFGSWRCSIDGRPSEMQWRVVNNPQMSCHGDVCSQSSGVKIVGSFSDRGSRWVPLERLSSSSDRLYMRHADGNRWMLQLVSQNRAEGYTTWEGRRYPLLCDR